MEGSEYGICYNSECSNQARVDSYYCSEDCREAAEKPKKSAPKSIREIQKRLKQMGKAAPKDEDVVAIQGTMF